jgi:hypothetical protein
LDKHRNLSEQTNSFNKFQNLDKCNMSESRCQLPKRPESGLSQSQTLCESQHQERIPQPFPALAARLEGEEDGFRGSGGRFAFTAAPNPENEQETL